MIADSHLTPIGATEEFSLRVSVATLVRVVFQNPKDRDLILALERKATRVSDAGKSRIVIKCQPFGGAIRIQSLVPFQSLLGDFHFDCEQSRSELDFRIFIRPADWEAVRESCLRYFSTGDDSVLEISPERELAEEFADALGFELQSEQFSSRPLGTVIEDSPVTTENVYARGYQTVRIYRIFEARIFDPTVCRLMMENSQRCSNQDLYERAMLDNRQGGEGKANAVLTIPMKPLMEFYLKLSPHARNAAVYFENNYLDGNICAILDGVPTPKYRSV